MSEEINLQQFSGKLPLFPLPHVVHYPNTLLPLHIFEKRYRQMLNDVLEGEKLIGMCVLKPGWEEKYQGNPAIYNVACLGRIVQHESLSDGRSNILLLGLKRVRIHNIIVPYPYRVAQVEMLNDVTAGTNKEELKQMKQRLLERYGEFVIEYADSGKNYPTLSDAVLSTGQLADAIAACLQFPTQHMVKILEELNVGDRAEYVLKVMNEMLHQKRRALASFRHSDFDIYLN